MIDAWLELPEQTWVREKLVRPKPSPKPRFLPVSVETFLSNESIDSGRWASAASMCELEAAVNALPTLKTEQNLKRVLRALYIRQKRLDPGLFLKILPRIPEEYLDHFYGFIKRFNDPRIRELGLEIFETDPVRGSDIMADSALAEDVPMIGALLNKLTDPDDIHSVGLDLIAIADRIPLPHLLRKLYDRTPCSFCRSSVIYKLTVTGEATKEMLEECLWDAEPEIRADAWGALQVGSSNS